MPSSGYCAAPSFQSLQSPGSQPSACSAPSSLKSPEITLSYSSGLRKQTSYIKVRAFSSQKLTLCPSSALTKYLATRNSCLPSDPFFIHSSRTVITRHWFASQLNILLSGSGLSRQFYSPHSFRIGAATYATCTGVIQHLIKTIGRWSSSAVQVTSPSPPGPPEVSRGLSFILLVAQQPEDAT